MKYAACVGLFLSILFGTWWLVAHFDRQVIAKADRYPLQTIEHDGHKFVVHIGYQKASIIHHPGCNCIAK